MNNSKFAPMLIGYNLYLVFDIISCFLTYFYHIIPLKLLNGKNNVLPVLFPNAIKFFPKSCIKKTRKYRYTALSPGSLLAIVFTYMIIIASPKL